MSERRAKAGRVTTGERIAAGGVAMACVGLLAIAAALEPAREGFGTHVQLTGRPCVWVGLFDQPCATCGMTTAFAYTAAGNLPEAFAAQPMGTVLALGTAATAWIALHVALTGSSAARVATRSLGSRALWVSLVGLLAAWVYKIVTWTGG